MTAPASATKIIEISSEVKDLRGVPIKSIRDDEARAILHRLVEEDPARRKPPVAAFNSHI
ncbi:hypothetical protein [Actinomadura sp. DC4]|uniref:hypothetical protein n=1 Tax=Actinomadura sp. DC4 TaxID=3055069 RepID=UPI0025B1D7A2|nr:hypothetical protein [Actinomadura sp. DC4]MDN3359122.1 hypothetical protein [Actinomadura sp. DC4]